jgi:tRNA pseudouridine13 synthase
MVIDGQDRALLDGGSPRYLTADMQGIGGSIKKQVSDFVVEELPLYAPVGEGEHTFFEIEKKGISTFQAVRAIAHALGVAPNRISYAGLKDAQAIACQVLSVHNVPPEVVTALDLSQIRVMWAERHRNKLKIGHLRGNRFTIRVRGVAEETLPAGRAIIDLLVRRGVPNWYGPQRFGQRGDSALLGKHIMRRDARAFIEHLLGGPHPNESERVQKARSRFDAGRWAEALDFFPHNMANERRAVHVLIDTGGDYGRAYASVPKRLKMFLLSAYQSALFNRVLDARLETLDQVFVGDLAVKHPGRSVFRVEDEAAEQPRADHFEISPTGPLFGYKMVGALGRQGRLEAEILAGEGLTPEDWRVGGGIKARGQRRALRFPVQHPELWFDEGVVLGFSLPRGCYATALLAEVMKVPLTPQVPEM